MFTRRTGWVDRIEWRLAAAVLASLCLFGVAPEANAQDDHVRQLIGDLQAKNPNKRDKAESALVKMGPSAVEPLTAALKEPDPAIRRAVASVLGKIKDPRVVEPLIGVLKDPNSGAQVAAALALGSSGDSRAVEPLIAALKDQSSNLRGSAAVALGKTKDPRAIDPLIGALGDAEAAVREGAVQALSDVGEPATAPLIAVLKDPDSHARQDAARALGNIGNARAANTLTDAWSASDLDVIVGASPFFIAVGQPGSEDTLISALNAHGNPLTAIFFLYSGNEKLAEAARHQATTMGTQGLSIALAGGGGVKIALVPMGNTTTTSISTIGDAIQVGVYRDAARNTTITSISSVGGGGSVVFAHWGSAKSDVATQVRATLARALTQPAPPSPLAQTQPASAPVPAREASSSGRSGKPLTNDDIKRMAAGGLNDDTIAMAIKARICNFDTSVAALIDLRKSGVSESVMKFMLGAPRPAQGSAEVSTIPPAAPSEPKAPATPSQPQTAPAAPVSQNPATKQPPSPSLPDLQDFTLLKFRIKSVEVSDTFEAKTLTGVSRVFNAPDGAKYYSVELVGHMDGLHEKYRFVCFNSKQFLAISDNAQGTEKKALYQGEAISTDFFGTVPDSNCGIPFGATRDEWHFTVLFVLPSGLKKFAIGVVDPKGNPVYTGLVADLTSATPAQKHAAAH